MKKAQKQPKKKRLSLSAVSNKATSPSSDGAFGAEECKMNHNSSCARHERDDLPMTIGDLVHRIDHVRIARRAYEIYESRHRADGHPDQDWFQAASEYAAHGESWPDGRRRLPLSVA